VHSISVGSTNQDQTVRVGARVHTDVIVRDVAGSQMHDEGPVALDPRPSAAGSLVRWIEAERVPAQVNGASRRLAMEDRRVGKRLRPEVLASAEQDENRRDSKAVCGDHRYVSPAA
jgi:hypothetical protein